MKGPVDWDEIERRVLGQLLPFQRRTVDWTFDRLYGSGHQDASRRFLVADEVGLGKTLVAKAVIAKALRHLDGKVKRVDIVYICSNAEIAAQNLSRLKIGGLPSASFQKQGRLTLLPLISKSRAPGTQGLSSNRINFLALTPSTSLIVKGDVGQALERALMCRLVQAAGIEGVSDTRWRNLFANRSSVEAFEGDLAYIDANYDIDQSLLSSFLKRLTKRRTLLSDLQDLTDEFSHKGKLTNRSQDVQDRARQAIGALRAELADVCIQALDPDLVVLDEFQRFPKLLDSEDEDSALARKLFDYPGVRLLMLSATPYRLWSDELEDPSGTGHYKEFLRTVSFLHRHDEAEVARVTKDLGTFGLLLRRAIQGDLGAEVALRSCRSRIEQQLSLVMARTDRVPATDGRDAMVRSLSAGVAPAPADFVAYAGLQQVAGQLDQPDMVEYWRSAPFPLSFLSSYKLRDKLLAALEAPTPELRRALAVEGLFMPTGDIEPSKIPNARTRHMAKELIGAGMHRLPWIPPSLPHYQLGGCFETIGSAARTKRLIFSSWKMVPRSVSSVLDAVFANALRREGVKPAAGRHVIAGNDYALGYPCRVFARDFEPLQLSRDLSDGGHAPTPSAIQRLAEERLAPLLKRLGQSYGDTSSSLDDPSWYWLGPLLIDMEDGGGSGESVEDDVAVALGTDDVGAHLGAAGLGSWPDDALERSQRTQLAAEVFQGVRQLGRMPEDLGIVLARLAVAGPATCALRSFGEVDEGLQGAARGAATAVALGLLGYLGNEQMIGQLEQQYASEPAFWRRVLMVCLDGCWSAVLDEYLAVLSHDSPPEAEGKDADDRVLRWLATPARIVEILSLKPSVLRPEQLEPSETGFMLKSSAVTLRHARPLLEREAGELKGEGTSSMTDLRNAFNSPFLPFVLSSTSVGQEGLDFHWYCHAIVHWNVPGSPVDFEQRDGRIHRFRNHAVRRNVAHDWGGTAGIVNGHGAAKQWQSMFEAAATSLIQSRGDMEGLRPSWIYRRGDGAAQSPSPTWMTAQQGDPAEIERHVPTMAYSRDCERYAEMTQALGCYRLVFAQPRQEDLLSHLMRLQAGRELKLNPSDLAISLRPPMTNQAAAFPKN